MTAPPPPLDGEAPQPPPPALATGVFTSQSLADEDDAPSADPPPVIPPLVTGMFATQSTPEDNDDDYFRDF